MNGVKVNDIKEMPLNIAKAFPIIIVVSGVLSSVVSGQGLGAVFAGGALVLGELLNWLLKFLFSKISVAGAMRRPNPPEMGCSAFGRCGKPASKQLQGMPSGHAQVTTFALVFWLLYIWNRKDKNTGVKATLTVCMLVIWYMVLYSRVYIGCHTYLQVGVGAAIGGLLGWGYYAFLNKVSNLVT